MKHRILALLCALALLLTGCAQLPTPNTETAAPSQTTELETAEPSTELPDETPAETSFFSGSATAGGVVVHTDESAYRPYAGAEVLYTRLRDEPIEELEPSADYGAIYPFVAARLFSAETDDGWQTGSSYGFIDASGRIVTDGSYFSIRAMGDESYDFGPVDEPYLPAHLPFWVMSRTGEPVTVTETDYDGEEYSWSQVDTRYGVASMDGSFVLPCVYSDVSGLEDSFVCHRSWSGREFEVYDLSGQLLFTGDELPFGDANGYYGIAYGDGLYLISFYGDGETPLCWFCDRTGSPVLGPYRHAEAFRDGLAAVSTDGEKFHYIDKTGAQAFPGEYDTANRFYNGRAIVYYENEGSALIDTTGRELLRVGYGTWINFAPCGYRVEKDEGGTAYYDWDGKLLFESEGYVECLDADTFTDSTTESSRIFRLNGPELDAPLDGYFYQGAALLDGEPTLGYTHYDYESDTRSFIPSDLSKRVVLDTETGFAPYGYGYSESYSTRDRVTGESWYLMWDGRAWIGLSKSGEQLRIPVRGNLPVLNGERIMVVTDRACVCLDREGNVVFSYPLENGD